MSVKYEGRIPKTLRQWIEHHAADTVLAVDYGGGYTTDSGNAYDVLLVPGYCVNNHGELMHTIIEPTIADVIRILKTIEPCHDDRECIEAWASRGEVSR